MLPHASPLSLALFMLVYFGVMGLSGFILLKRRPGLQPVFYFLLAAGSVGTAFSGLWGLECACDLRSTLGGGLPSLPFHVRLDALSSFFLLLLGGASTGILIFSGGYFKTLSGPKAGRMFLRLALFLGTMTSVVLADDAYLFMLSWESMALVSFFLVITDDDQEEVRHAGYLYLLMAHLGSLLILVAFALLATHETSGRFPSLSAFSFEAMGKTVMSPAIAFMVFFSGFLGFGAKAGLLPLHVWLPEAHPVAPTPVSSLLSGVMLKTAIYGLIRVFLGLEGLEHIFYQWGVAVFLAGAFMALFGILYALLQSDPKKLLAYSSIENIGIILLGLGLSVLYLKKGFPVAGVIALAATLYHSINHAFFKSLLFLGAGTMIHASGKKDLNAMGGLLRKMPISGLLVLIGVLSISGLPPMNGFVSEWLMLQSTLQVSDIPQTLIRSIILLGAALLVLASALAAMGFVKFFGIGYLGLPRSEGARQAREASVPERVGMAWLVTGCFALGLFPTFFLRWIDQVIFHMTGLSLPDSALSSGWLWLVPDSRHSASYSPLILFILLLLFMPLGWGISRWFGRPRRRRTPAWTCGYDIRTPRMQDSAGSFGQPIRHFFANFFLMKRHLPDPEEKDPVFELTVEDPHWFYLYRPILHLFFRLASLAEKVRTGKISVYLIYSFITLLLLLTLLRWL